MANTINIPKAHLIMALCLPLAVLLGYFVADPLDSGSISVLVLVLFVLAVPLMMKWHHPLLVLSWNAGINPYFLPGRPFLWMIMAAASLLFAVLNRSVSAEKRFVYAPSIGRPLILLAVVVFVTAVLTGGIGLHSMGSSTYGGRNYIFVLTAIAGYFALTSERIPAKHAGWYLALFFLPGLTSLLNNLAYAGGPSFYFLLDFVPPEGAIELLHRDYSLGTYIARYSSLVAASVGVSSFLLARYGVSGIFDLAKPWRLLLFVLSVLGVVLSGYRSALILFLLVFACAFWLEGLWRTRLLPILGGVALLTLAWLLPTMDQLPLAAQRTLSVLPGRVNPIVRQSADDTVVWRVDIWQMVLPDIPKYLIKGKGFAMDPNDVYRADGASFDRTLGASTAGALAAGDYHNGPLSLIIPFGIFGVISFAWFLVSGVRFLYYHYRFGDPALKQANTLLLAALIAKIIFFVSVFGGFYSDLYVFTGLVGLGVSLNGEATPHLVQTEPDYSLEETVEADLAA